MSNLNSVTKLTEFPRLEQKEKADGLLSKFIWWRKPDAPPISGKADGPGSSGPSSIVVDPPEVNDDNISLDGQRGASKDENTNPSLSSIGGASGQRIRKTSSSSPLPSYYRSDSTLSNRSTSNQSPEIMDGSISPFAFEARTLPNVLRRISSLIAMGTNNQTDIKKYWMPDSVSKECYECAEKFTTFRRKHHCRICGHIFCSRCCNQEIPGKIIGYSGDLRVCTYCSKIVLSYLQSALSSDMSDDLRVVQEDLQNRFGPSDSIHHHGGTGTGASASFSYYGFLSTDQSSSYRSLPRRKISLGYQEERFATSRSIHDNVFDSAGLSNTSLDDKQKSLGEFVNLKTLWEELTHPVTGIDWATHRHNMMKHYHSCVVGSELVDWLLAQRKISWRGQGIQIGQMLIDANLIECVSQAEQVFLDAYALYRPIQLPLPPVHESSEPGSTRSSHDFGDGLGSQDPLWVKQIGRSNNSSNQHSTSHSSDEHGREESSGQRRRRRRDSNGSTQSNQNLIGHSHSQHQQSSSSSPYSPMDQAENRYHGSAQKGEQPIKSRLQSTNSTYSLDLNFSENTVYISKPKDSNYESNSKSNTSWDPYNNQSSPTAPRKSSASASATTPKNNSSKLTSMSVTTETMTDEFLQKTLQLQKDQGKDFVAPTGWHSPHQLTSDSDLLAFQRLCNAFIRHENEFLNQLLESMNLSQSWADIILPIVHKVTEFVRPDVRHADDEMDIRQYVQFKKVSGGKKEDCRIVNGVVCTKNIAHRNMRQKLKDPKILIIGSSIDYQRFENRFLSLEPLVMQEYDYLRNTVARIASFQPDLVLVEKTVSRLAQDLMLEQGITLVINVKPSVMERVARCTQAVISTSADSQIGMGLHLGMCHNFYVENFRVGEGVQKNLMFFDGCAMHLGCTVLLRGAANSELMKVKRIISLLTFVAYNWRLERSFHIDLFAMPPDDNYAKDPSTLTDVLMESPGGGDGESEDFVSAHESSVDSSSSGKSPSSVVSSGAPSNAESPVKSAVGSNNISISNNSNNNAAAENKKNNAKSEICDPGSDPLQSFLASGGSSDDSQVLRVDSSEKLVVQFVPDSSKYSLRACIDEVKLSSSPFIKYSLPYLETEAGKNCMLRKFFPQEIYWSPLLHRSSAGNSTSNDSHHLTVHNSNSNSSSKINGTLINPKIQWKPPHSFTSLKITTPVTSDEIQASVADFRRKGGRLDFASHSSQRASHSSMSMSHMNSWNVLDHEHAVTGTGKQGNARIDALDPFRHQKLSVLFCSYSPSSCNAPYFCVNPWVVNMDLYGRHDISLGMFLERYCFRKTYHCPARQCDTPMLLHLRRFVHEDGCVQVASKELESPIKGSGDNILMWNWCTICTTVSPIVPMSVDAWSLSFAKYLELRFHSHMYKRRPFDNHNCDHSLHHDYVHYFAQHNIISWFKYSKIKLWEICLPAISLQIKTEPKSIQQLIDDVKVVAVMGHGVYSSILEALLSLKETSAGLRVEEVVTSLLDHLKAERQVFRTKIEEIQINLTVPSLDSDKISKRESEAFLWKVTDSIAYLRSIIADTIQSWNTRLHDLLALRKKEEKQAKSTLKVESEATDSGSKPIARIESDPVLPNYAQSVTSSQQGTRGSDLDESRSIKSGEQSGLESSTELHSTPKTSLTSGSTLDMSISGVLDELTNISIPSADDAATTALIGASSDDLFAGSWSGNNNSIDKKNTTMSPPSPSQSIRSDQVSVQTNHERSKSDGAEKLLKNTGDLDLVTTEDSPDFKVDKKLGSSAVKTIISHFLTGSGLGQVIQSPWLATDHYFLAASSSIPMSVHESEPSSVVAFALSSNEYKTKLADIVKNNQTKVSKSCEEDDIIIGKKAKYGDTLTDDAHQSSISPSYSTKGPDREFNNEKSLIDLDQDEKERPVKGNGNIEIQFGSSTAKFYCRVYFAEQFCQLRALCMDVSEEFYIRSIARCISWNATGGKSGSTFCKTVDDRFVVKQMSKFEIQSFLDFAPNYFEYIRKCYQDRKPTVLAKIVGVYRIGYRNSATGTQSKMDILIMENLFYERNISQKFDLKGSIRNRLANVSGKEGKEREDLVLLDENLVNMACENPLYIRPHTKSVLTVALGNDSQFLSSQLVMDYSLLVGLDEQKNELVVGIIDYIRTFTWDKKIETFVKSSGILGGQGKMPTVVSPDEYYTRFLEAMDRYFNLVPDRWMGLGNFSQ